jgi:hypothetical protein
VADPIRPVGDDRRCSSHGCVPAQLKPGEAAASKASVAGEKDAIGSTCSLLQQDAKRRWVRTGSCDMTFTLESPACSEGMQACQVWLTVLGYSHGPGSMQGDKGTSGVGHAPCILSHLESCCKLCNSCSMRPPEVSGGSARRLTCNRASYLLTRLCMQCKVCARDTGWIQTPQRHVFG